MLTETSEGILLSVKVIPKSSVNKIYAAQQGTLKIKVTAPADKNLANEAVISLMSKALGLAKSSIYILKGAQSKHKTLCILNQSLLEMETQLETILKNLKG
jgi:uncharacterized protein (TIGR00251 family)